MTDRSGDSRPSGDSAAPGAGAASDPGENAPIDDLVEAVHGTRVAVIGGGIAGLVAALECAKLGLAVTVLEAAPELGGTIGSVEIGGHVIDTAVDGYATTGGHVRRLVDELGLGGDVVATSDAGPWVSGVPGGVAPLPAGTVLGIPENTWDPAVRRIIGWRGVWRAYVDRLRPPLTIGHEKRLGALVRSRMGARVEERLVAPLSVGRHGLTPDEVDVDVAAPGLNAALTRAGSLGGAVAVVRGSNVPDAPGYETIRGGMTRLVAALRVRLVELGADIVTDCRVETIEPLAPSGAVDAAPGQGSSARWRVAAVRDGEAIGVDVQLVIVATGETVARELLAPHLRGLTRGEGPTRVDDVVTLVIDDAELRSHPRGIGVLPLPGTRAASNVSHVTARWPAVAEHVGEHEVIRVTMPAPVGTGAVAGSDAEVIAAAVAEASALLGVTISQTGLVGAHRGRHEPARPQSAIGQIDDMRRVRASLRDVAGLGVVGGWLSGSGLAQVIPDAVAEAERVRRAALWGSAAGA